MNNKCTINPTIVYNNLFKHRYAYYVLFYIMINYNINKRQIIITSKELINKIGGNHRSVKEAIDELISRNIIFRYKGYKTKYYVNTNIFINF